MAPKSKGLSLSDFVLFTVYLTYGLGVHCLTSLSTWVNSSCQHVWLKLIDTILHPSRVAANIIQKMNELAVSSCRRRRQIFSSNFTCFLSFAPSIATVKTLVVDLCCNAKITAFHHCACTLCTALSQFMYAVVSAFPYPIVRAGQVLCQFVTNDLASTVVAVLRVTQFFWHKFQDNSTNDISSHDGPHVASGQQSVTSSTAPPKIAARFNIHSSCGACQIDDTLVVKVAQLASLGWDQKTRCKWASICGKDNFEGFWDMVPCTFNPCYRQLAPHYPEELSLIGRGTMGTVTYAETQDDDGNWMPCAVKCQPYFETHIKEIVDKEVTVLEAMSGSAHTLTLVSHNTALLEGQMHKYIATRYLETVNMESMLSADLTAAIGEDLNNRLSAILVAFEGIIQGVVDMHDAGWAHLDLKPANICMELKPGTLGGHSYVIDYGSALKIGTGSYDILSTWWFAAPEVLAYNLTPCEELLDKVNFQGQDAWSLGCVLIWLLTGHDPFSLSNEDCAELDIRDAKELQQALRKRQLAWYKRRKGNTEVFVSATVQRFTELVREKQHPVLDRLHELASHLLTHRRSARFTARQALEEVKMLASMKTSSM